MFERFTNAARRVTVNAQEEARLFKYPHIGIEHLLLALAKGDGIATRALAAHNIGPETTYAWLDQHMGEGPGSPRGHIPFTPQAKKVMELSVRESLQLGQNYIGTEHLLLALIRLCEDEDFRALTDQCSNLQGLRISVIDILTGGNGYPERPGFSEAELQVPAVLTVGDSVELIAAISHIVSLVGNMPESLQPLYHHLDAQEPGSELEPYTLTRVELMRARNYIESVLQAIGTGNEDGVLFHFIAAANLALARKAD